MANFMLLVPSLGAGGRDLLRDLAGRDDDSASETR